MHIPPLLQELVIIFLISILVNTVCSRVRLPATVGFLLTGIMSGPSVLGIISDIHSIDILSEIGVALLLFTIGMELSGDALARLKKPVFLGGGLQIGLTIVVAGCLYLLIFNKTLPQGIFTGCLVALSSSAIVLRLLQEKGTIATPAGKLSLAILVFQDIMVAPMMLLIPLLGGKTALDPAGALWAFGKVVVVFGAVLLFAKYGLHSFMAAIVRTRVRELLLLTTLGLCMGMALITSWLGLSLSLGAFLAGLFLARSEYSMSVVSGVLPYRDVFMSIFFISVGMLLNVQYLMEHLTVILLSSLAFICIKTLLTLPAILLQNYPLRTAIISSLILSQVGEFSFILAKEGLDAGLLSANGYQNFLAMSIITMMLTPALINFAPKIAQFFCRSQQAHDTKEESTASTKENHLIIVGFGISGQHLARVAKKSSIPYEILEMNPDTVSRYQQKEPIHYGDASQPAILEHLGIAKAKAIAIVISDPTAVQATVAEARALNPNIRIVARTRFLAQVETLQSLGASDVIAEEFEASVEVFSRVLHLYMVPKQDIDALTAIVRNENYAMLRTIHQQQSEISEILNDINDVSTQSIRLEQGAYLCDKSLAESNLRKNYNIMVVAIKKKEELISAPDANYKLKDGDIIYIFGKQKDLQNAMELFIA